MSHYGYIIQLILTAFCLLSMNIFPTTKVNEVYLHLPLVVPFLQEGEFEEETENRDTCFHFNFVGRTKVWSVWTTGDGLVGIPLLHCGQKVVQDMVIVNKRTCFDFRCARIWLGEDYQGSTEDM